jgi:hypothetical protein
MILAIQVVLEVSPLKVALVLLLLAAVAVAVLGAWVIQVESNLCVVMVVMALPQIFLAQKLSMLAVAEVAVKQPQAQDLMFLTAAQVEAVTQGLTLVRLLQGLQTQVVAVAVAGMLMARLVDQVL